MNPRENQRGAFVLSRLGARELDRLALEEFGLPTIVLMENAAHGLAETTLDELERTSRESVLVFCGRGNNGGDGFAAARHLANAGVRVHCVCERALDQLAGDALVNARAAHAMGIGMTPDTPRDFDRAPLVVDAILGTGLRDAPAGRAAELIAIINDLAAGGAPVVAADIPSGLDCDSGLAQGAAVRATVTATFAGLKQGFLQLQAQAWTGDVVVVDIGVPRVLLERCGRWLPEPEMGAWEFDGPGSPDGPDESGPARRFGDSGR